MKVYTYMISPDKDIVMKFTSRQCMLVEDWLKRGYTIIKFKDLPDYHKRDQKREMAWCRRKMKK